jgi:hypothetical protein
MKKSVVISRSLGPPGGSLRANGGRQRAHLRAQIAAGGRRPTAQMPQKNREKASSGCQSPGNGPQPRGQRRNRNAPGCYRPIDIDRSPRMIKLISPRGTGVSAPVCRDFVLMPIGTASQFLPSGPPAKLCGEISLARAASQLRLPAEIYFATTFDTLPHGYPCCFR